MDLLWRRPESVPFPQTWLKFLAKDLDSEKLVEYRVEDLTPDRFEDAIEHMSGDYFKDEPFCRGKNIVSDPAAMEAFKSKWRGLLEQRVSVVCYREGSDEIVGVNILAIYSKNDQKQEPKFVTQLWTDMMEVVGHIIKQSNPYQKYNTDCTMFGWGLSVSKKYRGRRIANEILRARIPLCKAIGVKLSTTVFTNILSQKCAESVGFKEDFVVSYDELFKINSGWDFRNESTEFCKTMSLYIE